MADESGGAEPETAEDIPDVTPAAIGGPRLSAPGTFVLIWGLSALALAAIDAADGVGAIEAFAAFAGLVGVGASVADLAFDRRPGTTVYLFVGVPALLGAGLAAIGEAWLTAAGLAVVGLATLGRVYGKSREDEEGTGGGERGGDGDRTA